ncbi:MAG: hypothetical protein Q7S27_00820 [Nanoarchaeota archaeon]|nr:hypothetical protein [Nanoarchaeota archaeon]
MNNNYNKPAREKKWSIIKYISLILAIIFIVFVWFILNYKLLLGDSWISPTYDNPDWRTNEGNLRTYGAWDFETHIWKTEYILNNFPHFNWNPYWYLGMPLIKYYQSGFYIMNILVMFLTGFNAAKAGLFLVMFGHLIAVLLTFLLCYKVSKKIFVSAFCSIFLLANTFITLRSYGWEPISVVFIFLYPLGLLVFLKDPLKPFRFSIMLVLAISYLCHPLIFFSLAMSYGLYLFSVAIRHGKESRVSQYGHYIAKYFAVVFCSLLISAVQFFPQLSYIQKSSGAHMGVSYIPFYHIPYNIITLTDFLFDAGNLKGPGLVIMVALFLVIVFGIYDLKNKNKRLIKNEVVAGFILIVTVMVLFYYMERYNIFPMNFFRSIQYHRIIPEFIIAACVLIASLSNVMNEKNEKIFYYSVLIIFVLASSIVIYDVQAHWQTTEDISGQPEFIYDEFDGRISFPYTDQSLAVRSSFQEIPQVYGYYEQGITNSYSDELFSVSSGFHEKETTILYLKAANVARLYINTEEGDPDKIMMKKLDELEFNHTKGERYGYFTIPLEDHSMAEVVDASSTAKLKLLEPGCRIIFKEKYCNSEREEFVSLDHDERRYLEEYIKILEQSNEADVKFEMINPDEYNINLENAKVNSEVVVKMTYDSDFKAKINGEEIEIEKIGPEFMLLKPKKEGKYTIVLRYGISKVIIIGAIVSIISFIAFVLLFIFKPKFRKTRFEFSKGDMK